MDISLAKRLLEPFEADKLAEAGVDLIALEFGLGSSPWDYTGTLCTTPSDGICDDIDELNARMMRLAQALGHPKNGMKDMMSHGNWGKLYFDRHILGTGDTRVWAIVFPDPELALGVARRRVCDSPNVRAAYVPDPVLASQFLKLYPNKYHPNNPSRCFRQRENGSRFFYPGGRVMTINWPQRPEPSYVWSAN